MQGPQRSIPLSATVLGLFGTLFWCIQLVPQIYKNWRRQSTDGLPWTMMLIWAVTEIPMGSYVVIQQFNIPTQIQTQLLCFFCLICLGQILVFTQ